jgi:hypothetical protein
MKSISGRRAVWGALDGCWFHEHGPAVLLHCAGVFTTGKFETLDVKGMKFNITRERIRKIMVNAMPKLDTLYGK